MLSVDDTVMLRFDDASDEALAVNALVMRSEGDSALLAVDPSEIVRLSIGMNLEIVAYVASGVFSTTSVVAKVDSANGLLNVHVSSTVHRAQHRRFLRVRERLSVVAFSVHTGPPERLQPLGVFESIDVSAGGLALTGRVPIARGGTGAFRFELRDERYMVRGVMTRSEDEISACQFVAVPLAVEQALVSAVNAIQRERIRGTASVR
jgi:hypothetical protein